MKCQQNKVQHQKKARELHLLEILEGPQQEISINIIGPLPQSKGKDTIVVIVNQSIHKNDMTQSNNNNSIITGNCKNFE